MVPGEACAERPERGNRGHIKKATLNAQESAEAIVPGMGRAEVNAVRSNRRKEDSMEKAENAGEGGCLQRDSTECKEYAGAQSAVRPEAGETEVREPRLLERILFRDNMNRA